MNETYDLLTNFGNIIAQYDLASARTTAFVIEEKDHVTMQDAPALPLMLDACLSSRDFSDLEKAIAERKSIEQGGKFFVVQPHQSPESLLEHFRKYLAA